MRAAELVREQLRRTTGALEAAGIPYAVIGAHAVAYWVARIDKAGVRNTPNADLLLRRAELDQAREALATIGFTEREVLEIPQFFDSPENKPRSAIQIFFAGERIRTEYLLPTPDVSESLAGEQFRVITLDALVSMKLNSFRTVDAVHLRDMVDVGLIDASWPARFLPELGSRLQHILDTPDG
jgi:hypothetical protein